jgi:hypothetical protein
VADDVLLTPNTMKLDVNGFPFGTISGSYRVSRDLVPRTSTEDSADRVKAGPFRVLNLQAMAQLDPDAGYHTPGQLDLFNPDGVWLRIWHNGRADPANVTDVPNLILSEEARNWNMNNSSAQEVNLTGRSDSDFFLPGE